MNWSEFRKKPVRLLSIVGYNEAPVSKFDPILSLTKCIGTSIPIPISEEHSRIEPESPATIMMGADQYDDTAAAVEGPALIGFARVNSVEHGSPAFNSGLRPGDTILRFGTVTLSMTGANRALHSIADLVRRSENRPISVTVHRETCPDPLLFVLTPRVWSGRGLLGCHIVPLIELEA